jgi:hypothetical protein
MGHDNAISDEKILLYLFKQPEQQGCSNDYTPRPAAQTNRTYRAPQPSLRQVR